MGELVYPKVEPVNATTTNATDTNSTDTTEEKKEGEEEKKEGEEEKKEDEEGKKEGEEEKKETEEEPKKEDEEETKKDGEEESTDAATNSTETDSATNSTATNSTASEPEAPKPKKVTHKEELSFQVNYEFPLPMSKNDKKAAAARLDEFTQYDQDVRDREASENNLEAYLYSIRDKLEDEYIQQASAVENRNDILKLVGEYMTWMDEETNKQTKKSEFDEKLVK